MDTERDYARTKTRKTEAFVSRSLLFLPPRIAVDDEVARACARACNNARHRDAVDLALKLLSNPC